MASTFCRKLEAHVQYNMEVQALLMMCYENLSTTLLLLSVCFFFFFYCAAQRIEKYVTILIDGHSSELMCLLLPDVVVVFHKSCKRVHECVRY